MSEEKDQSFDEMIDAAVDKYVRTDDSDQRRQRTADNVAAFRFKNKARDKQRLEQKAESRTPLALLRKQQEKAWGKLSAEQQADIVQLDEQIKDVLYLINHVLADLRDGKEPRFLPHHVYLATKDFVNDHLGDYTNIEIIAKLSAAGEKKQLDRMEQSMVLYNKQSTIFSSLWEQFVTVTYLWLQDRPSDLDADFTPAEISNLISELDSLVTPSWKRELASRKVDVPAGVSCMTAAEEAQKKFHQVRREIGHGEAR